MDATSTRGRRVSALLILALLAGLVAWSPGLEGPYQFDDYATPLDDPASQSLSAWMQQSASTLRPLSKLTYAVEAEAGLSDQPQARRLLSLLLLATAATLLGWLMLRLLPALSAAGAGLLALLWFLHPVHADSVLMVGGRNAVLAACFLLAALLAQVHSRRWLAALLFAAACLSRETALAGLLPLAVLAVGTPDSPPRRTLRGLAPVLAAAALVACWLISVPRYVELAEYSFLGRPWWQSLIAQVGAVPVGLELLLQPSRLSIDYGLVLPDVVNSPTFLTGILLYVSAAAGVLLMRRRSRPVAVGLALWLAALLPTQSIIPKLDALSNRPLGLALAGLLIAASPLLAGLMQRLRLSSPWRRGSLAAAAMVLPLALAVATWQRSGLFASELALWQDAAIKSATNARPHLQTALLLKRAGRDRDAWREIALARAIDPFSPHIDDLYRIWNPEKRTP